MRDYFGKQISIFAVADDPALVAALTRDRSAKIEAPPAAPPVAQDAPSAVRKAAEDMQTWSSLGKSSSFPPSKAEQRRLSGQSSLAGAGNECPPYGSKSVIGRRAKMEDACVAVPYLMEVPLCPAADELLPPRIAPQLRSTSGSERSSEAPSTTAFGSIASEDQAQASGSGSVGQVSRPASGAVPSHQAHLPPLAVPPSPAEAAMETLHFFGVFDGHGGADAAMHCAKTLHERVKEVLSDLVTPGSAGSGNGTGHEARPPAGGEAPEASSSGDAAAWRGPAAERPCTALSDGHEPSNEFRSASSGSSYADTDNMEEGDASAPADGAGMVEGVVCTTETVEAALTKAFHMTDEEFGTLGGYEHLALVGTTAVVALVGSRMIYVANCGDSRAVLCRDGAAVPLTDDHKAAREDETARVEAAGGQILFWNGVRVMGLLAVSRAIGDHSLRPYVIAEPEVTIVNRHAGDELLVLASDGLWDVMSNQEACTLAKKCLLRAQQRGSSKQSAARVAATVLTRAAVDRGSRDNVTVVIVDLATSSDDGAGAADVLKSLPSHDGNSYEGPAKPPSSKGSGVDAPASARGQDPPPELHSEREQPPAAEDVHMAPSERPAVAAPVPSPFDVGQAPPAAVPMSPSGSATEPRQPELTSPFDLGGPFS